MASSINDIKNFSGLLSAYGVNIPLIQRDYVQGRVHDTTKLEGKGDETSKKLLKKYLLERERRDNFVSQLISALEDPVSNQMQLTFIYGDTETIDTNSMRHDVSFIPLDGQQRLTTLFLLAWILMFMQEDEAYKTNPFFDEFEKGMRSFSYKTRPSSGAFCYSIMNDEIQPTTGSISEKIQAQSWFGNDWKMDPSVSAMLQMLDQMEEMLKSKDVKTLFENLLNGKGIEFELLNLEHYKLTDGLYIKMNARGKQLTEFENWKSEFIGFLEEKHSSHTYGQIDQTTLEQVFEGNQPTLKEYFAHSIEHQWTDLFWAYCKQEIEQHSQKLNSGQNLSKRDNDCYPVIDDYFMRVFEKLTQIFFFVNDSSKKTATDYKPSKEIRNAIYEKADTIEELFAFLDLLCSFDDQMFNDLFFTTNNNQNTNQNGKVRLFDNKGTNLLTRCAKNEDSTDISNVLLYALLRYAKEFGVAVDDDMKYFIRSVRNCIESKQYLSSKEVRMVNDFNINDIVSKNVLDKIKQLISDKKNGTAKWSISPEKAAIEDFDFICGNMRNPVPAGLSAQFYDVLKNWDSMRPIEKIQLLIAYGFTGHYIMTCGHGDLYFFGADKRWKTIFVHDDSRGNGAFDQVLNDIVNDYCNLGGAGTINLSSLLNNKKFRYSHPNDGFSFKYYALKYDYFFGAHARNKQSHYYFSRKGTIDEMDIEAMQYSGKPTMAYHTDPIVFTLKTLLQNQNVTTPSHTLYLGYSVTGAERACLEIYNTKTWDNNAPIAILRHKEGIHGHGGWELLDGTTRNQIQYQPDNSNSDRVQDGINFVNSLYTQAKFEEKG